MSDAVQEPLQSYLIHFIANDLCIYMLLQNVKHLLYKEICKFIICNILLYILFKAYLYVTTSGKI